MARNRPKHVEKIGVAEIYPVISYLQKHHIGSQEIERAWKSAGGLDALVRFTRRRLRQRASGQKVSLVRKSLEQEVRRQHRQKITEVLTNKTRLEIKEELAVVRACREARDAWGAFQYFGTVPQLVRYEYDKIFDTAHSKKEFEPTGDIKKGMVALALTDVLCNPIVERDPYGHRWEISASGFVRMVVKNEKGHATWDNVNYVLEPIRQIMAQRIKVLQTIDRLKERLSEMPDDDMEADIKKVLLDPLQDALGTQGQLQELKRALTELASSDWYNDLNQQADRAVERLENILKSLPDPNKVPCVEATRRIVEIFESEPEEPKTSIQNLEDASILEHVNKCFKHPCYGLRDCVTTVLDYAVIREWSDKSPDFTREKIMEAKKFLKSQEN